MPDLSHVVEEQVSPVLRVDRYISEVLRLFSRSQIKARNLKVKINGNEVKLSRTVRRGDIVDLFWEESPPENIVPQDIPLDVIYEDERCIVVNKTHGMVVHPGAGNRQNTLANAVYFRMISRYGSAFSLNEDCAGRPGIVHRLDKDTSGAIIAAYDDEAHAFLAKQFKTRKAKKTYIAIICGTPKETDNRCRGNYMRIETFIARDPKNRKRFTVSSSGKNSVTFLKVIKSWHNYSLVLLRPKTGRTHQLRVHMRYLGHPILGDPVYGFIDKNFPQAALMLHSKKLEITLPGETYPRSFSAPLPQRFAEVIEKLNG